VGLEVPRSPIHIELSGNNTYMAADHILLKTGFPEERMLGAGSAYLSRDGKRVLAGGQYYQLEPTPDELPALNLSSGNIIPSSNREFIFLRVPVERAFIVYNFNSGRELQRIKIGPNERLLKNTDDGNRLLFRDDFSKVVRVFSK